ncbi:MAG TPA: hypothetical protein VKV25_09245, partial [Acidimicrobiales bacterium]|nr:hypothetical protein [Acidimicrobiales bacterium]
GWVVADPTPESEAREVALPPTAGSPAPPTTLAPRPATAVPGNLAGGQHPLAPPAHLGGAGGPLSTLWWVVIALGVVLAAGAAAPGVALVRRELRRRARRRGTGAAVASGAWLEVLDTLERVGAAPALWATAEEVAAEVERPWGPEAGALVRHVGELADRAICAPRHPPALEEAERAWAELPGLRRALLGRLDRRERAAAALRVGSQPRRAVPAERRDQPPAPVAAPPAPVAPAGTVARR